jgi:hypothetical protein
VASGGHIFDGSISGKPRAWTSGARISSARGTFSGPRRNPTC